jgi:type III secretion protein V
MDRLDRLLQAVAKRQDLVIVFFILGVIALMILPLPLWLMDLMIALNITIGMLFLLLAVYLKSPLEFSTLPSAILIATLVRIAITISTARLVLVQGDAGSIIQAFGEFVIAGNVIVGLVIFIIIAIAQFIVVTKGAERVAEVAARFALDALPGKQMSIDSDLRAGDIDRKEASRRRSNLERESQYYGAMDGAMKFVKGDAIVSMIIILVNLIGGLLVGTTVHGMDMASAFNKYALLTVGDGLASQIPALLVAIAGGIVVTRVTTETSENLGTDLARELVSSPRSLGIAGGVLALMALVPGFPAVQFLGLAALLAGGALGLQWMTRREAAKATAATVAAANAAKAASAATPGVPARSGGPRASIAGETFTVRMAPDLASKLDLGAFATSLDQRLAAASQTAGIGLLTPGFRVDPRLASRVVELDVDGAPTWRSTWPLDRTFIAVAADVAKLEQANDPAGADLPGLGRGVWVTTGDAQRMTKGGQKAYPPAEALAAVVTALVSTWAPRSFGLTEADTWLQQFASGGATSLAQQLRAQVPLTRFADVMRQLLAEGVAMTQPRLVAEAMIDLAPRVEDNGQLVDQLRLALSRPLSAQYADENRTIGAVVIEFDLEDHLRQALREGPAGTRINLNYGAAEGLANTLRAHWDKSREAAGGRSKLIMLTAYDIRRPLRQFVAGRGLDMPVLAYEEVAPDYEVIPVTSLGLAALDGKPDTRRMTVRGAAAGA